MKPSESTSSQQRANLWRRSTWCGVLLTALIGVVFALLPRGKIDPQLRWEFIPVKWEEIGQQLSFTLGPITVGQETYTLEDCHVETIVPYAEEALRGDFQYLYLSYRGKIVSSTTTVTERNTKAFSVIVLARPKLLSLTPAQFGLTAQEATDLVISEDNESTSKAWRKVALKEIEQHIAKLTFSTTTHLSDESGMKTFLFSTLPHPTRNGIDVPFNTTQGE